MTRILTSAVLFGLGLILLLPVPATAVDPDEMLKDPKLESRARDISLNLRCLVCQNQSIDDSNAPLAKDLRVLVRDRLSKGDSDEQVVDYIVDRYGEYVLLRPRFGVHTLVLWLGPFALLLAALAYFYMNSRQVPTADSSKTPAVGGLTKDEKTRLAKLMDGE